MPAALVGSPPEKIRNVVLLGHGGTGKTALAEALLSVADAGTGRGGTFDFEPEEKDRGRSLSLATASLRWRDHTINVLDAPGGPDAVGDAYAALLAADVALFVVDAVAGVQAQHDELWEACAAIGLPRVVFLNKLDRESAGYQRNIDALSERYGKPLAPVHMPVGVEQDFLGVIDLLHGNAIVLEDGKRVERDIPAERMEQAERNRELLIEAIVENDDEMLERYLEGEVPSADELADVFGRGIAGCGFFPVLCGSVELVIGVRLLADFLIEECPSPVDRVYRGRADGDETDRHIGDPTTLYVAKTLTDPYVGRVNILRVVSGRVAADDVLTVHRTGANIRLHQLFQLCGKEQAPIDKAGPGDIIAVAKLDDVLTGDTLHAKEAPFAVTGMRLPEAYHRTAVEPESAGDEDKLSLVLTRMTEEDPTLKIQRDGDSHQVVLRVLGPTHADVTLARMARKFGVSVREVPLRIAYRETLKGSGSGLGRHVKQSGGHGQYGIAEIEVEPLERGAGFEFENRIVGGVIPTQFISSVEKGIREAMAHGVLAGYPVVDVRVRLVDGKHHSVDSSQVAFEIAGSLAFRDAAQKAGLVLLEPILEVEVVVPDTLTGDVMGDLSAKRGRIIGTEAARAGTAVIRAHVPEGEMLGYVGELRSLSSGTGRVQMRYDHHTEMPEHQARKLVQELEAAPA